MTRLGAARRCPEATGGTPSHAALLRCSSGEKARFMAAIMHRRPPEVSQMEREFRVAALDEEGADKEAILACKEGPSFLGALRDHVFAQLEGGDHA